MVRNQERVKKRMQYAKKSTPKLKKHAIKNCQQLSWVKKIGISKPQNRNSTTQLTLLGTPPGRKANL